MNTSDTIKLLLKDYYRIKIEISELRDHTVDHKNAEYFNERARKLQEEADRKLEKFEALMKPLDEQLKQSVIENAKLNDSKFIEMACDIEKYLKEGEVYSDAFVEAILGSVYRCYNYVDIFTGKVETPKALQLMLFGIKAQSISKPDGSENPEPQLIILDLDHPAVEF